MNEAKTHREVQADKKDRLASDWLELLTHGEVQQKLYLPAGLFNFDHLYFTCGSSCILRVVFFFKKKKLHVKYCKIAKNRV